MEMIRGRTLAEVRRYDWLKLIIAALLFINALYFCGGAMQKAAEAPPKLVQSTAPAAVAPAALALSAGYAWVGDKLTLTGTVKDEATRKAIVDEAVKAMGSADKVVDQLKLDALAPVIPWQGKLAEVITWGKGKGDGAVQASDKAVLLTGKVSSEADKKARGDAAAALFGADYKIDNQIVVEAPVAVLPPPPAAKLYFGNNQTQLPANAGATLETVIAWAKAAPGNKLAVSGFHSASGSLERNHELAKGRALEVANLLNAAGVLKSQIELRKPTEELGGSDPAQARRVEVGPAN